MARTRDRIIALIIAITFFVTSLTLTFFAVWALVKDNKEASNVDNSSLSGAQDGPQLQGTQLQGFTPVPKVESLQITDTKVGTGEEVKPGDSVLVDYTGAVAATGVIFQSSLDMGEPVSFGLNGVIKGWTEGIPGMKVGGERRLLIPAAMAYGSTPPEGIPVDADLVFDVTLHSIVKE